MARNARAPKLETRSNRLKLPVAKKPTFVRIAPGISLGYRRNERLAPGSSASPMATAVPGPSASATPMISTTATATPS